jgi:energy-coupling factor transporter ATP-binding protein EcfA2
VASVEMERALLHRILAPDPVICAHATSTLAGYKFSEEWTDWTWQFITAQFTDAGEIPERAVIEAQAASLPTSAAEQLLLEVQTIFDTPATTSPRSIIRSLLQTATTEATLKVMERASEKFATGDPEEAKRILATAATAPEARPGPRIKPVFPRSFVPLVNGKRIETGLRQLDEIIGGIQEGEMGLIFGVTGMGKSALSTTLGRAGVRQEVMTLHIDTENGEHITRSRYISSFTGIPAKLIERNTMGKETRGKLDLWLSRNHERLARYLQVVYLGMEEHTMEDLEGVIVSAHSIGFVPRLAVFDSPDHLLMDNMEHDARWEKFAAIANRWRRLCERYKFGGWAVSQADMAFESKMATGRSVADSKQKVRNASIAISINQALHPKTKKPLGDNKDLWLDKARNSPGKRTIPLLCNLDTMSIKSPPRYQHPLDDGEETDEEETA